MIRCLIGLATIITLCSCVTRPPTGPQRFVVEKRWVRNTLVREHLGSRRSHRFSPVVTEQLIIEGNSIDGLVAYDRKSAQVRWRLPIKDGVEGGAELVGDDLFFGASDGFFYSVKASTGQVQWTFPIRSEGLSRPFVQSDVVYFIAGNNVAHALDAKSGRLLWVYTRRDPSNLSIRGGSQPNVSGDMVYVGFSDGFLVALKKQTGAVQWETALNRNRRFRDVDAHPVIDGERIYITSYDGALYAVQKTDGRILWSVEEGGESAVTVSGSHLFYSSSTGKTMSIDKDSGKILWSRENRRGISTQPALYRDLVAVGEMHGTLQFLDARTGSLVGEFDPGWGVTSDPVVDEARGEIYFMSAGANLYSLRLAWRKWARIWPWEN